MLVITIHNDGTGTDEASNYNCKIMVTPTVATLRTIAESRVEGHRRADGWERLVTRMVCNARNVEDITKDELSKAGLWTNS